MNYSILILLFSFEVVFGVFLVFAAIWLNNIKKVVTVTHQIVNSQRSAMQNTIYLLCLRVANDHPEDDLAQNALDRAKMELDLVDKPRRVSL